MSLLTKYQKLTEDDWKQIERAREEIRYFENKYGLSSEEFVEKWRTSTEPLPVEDIDANLWVTHFAFVGKKEEKANNLEPREYTAQEIDDFLAADRLDTQTADKVSRLLEQNHNIDRRA